MQFKKVRAEVKNVNSSPESHGDEQQYRSDIKLALAVPVDVVNRMLPGGEFLEQFYVGDDVRLESLFPIKFGKRLKDHRATLHFDDETMRFEPVKIKAGQLWTPLSGRAVSIEMTLQVYPDNPIESGRLDFLAQQWIDVEIEPLNKDIDDTADDEESD